jgi:hypothetical protein
MKCIATAALILNFGVAGVYAQQKLVKMSFSGSNVATTINLQTNTVTDETQLAGTGSLGQFTFRELHADGPASQPPSGCLGPYFGVVAGAGVFRFQDESLLIVTITDGSGCVNPAAGHAVITVNYQISGGTGRFAGASGNLTMTATIAAVLFNAANAPELLANTGKFEGRIFGVDIGKEGQDDRQ